MPGQLATLQQPDGHAELHRVDVIPLLQACFEAQPKPHSVVLLSGKLACQASLSRLPANEPAGLPFFSALSNVGHVLQACLQDSPRHTVWCSCPVSV